MQKVKTLYEINGAVDRIIFRNEQNGYRVIELSVENELVTAVGMMPYISVGENVKLLGNFKSHPTFGEQFTVEACERSMPTTTAAILKYLSSGAIKGIGPSTACKLVERFGEKTLEVIEKNSEELTQIRGITKEKARKISEEFTKLFSIRELMIYLGKYGITPEEAIKIYKIYGQDAVKSINENPYLLCEEPLEISFERADKLAYSLEQPQENVCRIRAGIVYILAHNMNNGHTCLPKDKLLEAAANFLSIDLELAENTLKEVLDDGTLQQDIINEKEFIFTNKMHQIEVYSAGRLLMMLKFPPQKIFGADKYIEAIEKKHKITYAKLQKKAITMALEDGILILTGGPGTGKTTPLNAIIDILEKNGEKVCLAAPTGRAAQRMAAVTGREAKTIHRLLEVQWDTDDKPTFKRNEKNLLECDAIILDELSMVDAALFEGVLRALPLGCRLILVGDSDQLPSVGAGNVLSDLIKSETIPMVELKEIFRQSLESLIVTNAHKIVNGELPELSVRDNDFFFMNVNDPQTIIDTIRDLCTKRLPGTYGYSPLFDIQVIAPGKKGPLGTININKVLQEAINSPSNSKKEININGTIFREGDKVMQIRNNYNIIFAREDGSSGEGVFNGDIGILLTIDKEDSSLVVQFDDKYAKYDLENASDLDLAYAITVHKSQGSEFEAVVMPVYFGAPQLYYRNLLYTAVTRAKSMIVMVGTAWTVKKMVENNKKTRRYSGLCNFLVKGCEN